MNTIIEKKEKDGSLLRIRDSLLKQNSFVVDIAILFVLS
jgi:hypothetical protein